MCASLAETGMEIRRVKDEWPPIYGPLEDLPGPILKSTIPVLHPDGKVHEVLVRICSA